MPGAMSEPAVDFAAIVDAVRLAVFVFDRFRIIYANDAAGRLQGRLRRDYQADLTIMLRDHLCRMQEMAPAGMLSPAVTLLSDPSGEPLYVHVLPLPGRDGDAMFAVTVRELGIEREAFARRFGLSPREVEVAELVLRGYANPVIAYRLGIAPTTAKRHLTRIFGKIGVDSRTQLLSRLA
jgi:DNA-binding CsgD family transcriptional regulator